MDLFFSAAGSDAQLRSELALVFPRAPIRAAAGASFEVEPLKPADEQMPWVTFSAQMLPDARRVGAESIRGWASLLEQECSSQLPEDHSWSLHVVPCYGTRHLQRLGARAWHSAALQRSGKKLPLKQLTTPAAVDAHAGENRCRLIRETVIAALQKRRRHLLRNLRAAPAPFSRADSLVQLILTEPTRGFLSVAVAPAPYELRHLISPFALGEVPVAHDQAAPSRAFAKLVEAELRLGCRIQPGETCVDLGAAPGSWTYVAVNRGARAVAVDRTPLRDDLMRHGLVQFVAGDAFQYKPNEPVDWLLCDVIAAPEQTGQLLIEWLRRGWCRKFVVTIKLRDEEAVSALAKLKADLPHFAEDLYLSRLTANKKEICAFGINRLPSSHETMPR